MLFIFHASSTHDYWPSKRSMLFLQVCIHTHIYKYTHTQSETTFTYSFIFTLFSRVFSNSLTLPYIQTHTHTHTHTRTHARARAQRHSHQYSIYWAGYFEVARRRAWQLSSQIKTILSWFLPHSREKRKLSVIVCFYNYSPFTVWVFTHALNEKVNDLSSAQKTVTLWDATVKWGKPKLHRDLLAAGSPGFMWLNL